ncbi:MAG: glycoside hydrolase family 1 protein [Archangium sp.]|nr:glycoside hydrolase family 1 protein [Archangium sp.]
MRTAFLISLVVSGCAVPVSKLPKDFHWGVATSGFQSEGSFPDSNWTRYTTRPGTAHEPYADSVDFFRRFRDDIALAASLGVDTFRFSIEWARVMPRRGVVDEEALRHYDQMFEALRERGMTPMPTLLHFVTPGWVLDEGGLASDSIVRAFRDFVEVVARRYRSRGARWVTLNEASYFLTLERRHGSVPDAEVERAKARLVQMHVVAFDLLHREDAGAPVSTNVVWEPAPASWFDDWFFERVAHHVDFIALDYYYALTLDLSVAHAGRGKFWRVNFRPSELLTALRDYHARAPHLPLYVVENGMATDDGLPRRDGYTRSNHLRDHIYWLQRARDEGIDVIGFNYWSLTDNYEWGDYRNRFGLFTVDVRTDATLQRKATDAVETFHELVKNGGVPTSYVPVK